MTYPIDTMIIETRQNGSQKLICKSSPMSLLEWAQITLEKRDHNGEYWHLTYNDCEEMIDAAMALECDATASYISWERAYPILKKAWVTL
jgi:hypothetical protein